MRKSRRQIKRSRQLRYLRSLNRWTGWNLQPEQLAGQWRFGLLVFAMLIAIVVVANRAAGQRVRVHDLEKNLDTLRMMHADLQTRYTEKLRFYQVVETLEARGLTFADEPFEVIELEKPLRHE